jgi:acetyl-CoA carboxylase biotin carboxylase subunit
VFPSMVNRVLVANRGEIATRLCAHLQTLGIHTIAVYSEADENAVHVHAANEAHCIGPAPVTDSYLNQERILQVAQQTDADAIHPGYGLLSENATFARAVHQAGRTWIGPTPSVIEAMGDKIAARTTATEAGVPVVPGSDGPVDDTEALKIAEDIGFPVLIKAAGGGGGIGMEVVKKPEKMAKALDKCRSRSSRSFGSDTVYVEKLLEAPRHIEIQVLFDQHENGVALFERECSIQRRYQKIVEEAPSVLCQTIPGLRERMCAAAISLGKRVGYTGVGTVEFLVDSGGNFYFMEMNTRLQVEHPVTECITGVDLVDWQIRVARGAVLDVVAHMKGHAIECRIYAEDPAKRFFPAPGTISKLRWPTGPGIRVDAGVTNGSVITPFYDPLVAKLIVSAADRATCIERLSTALDETIIEGLTTNLDFHRWLVRDPAFQQGKLTTNFVKERFSGA